MLVTDFWKASNRDKVDLLASLVGKRNAELLIDTYQSLNSIACQDAVDLHNAIPGLKAVQVRRMQAAFRIGSTLVNEGQPDSPIMNNSHCIAKLLREEFRYAKNEEVRVVLMNNGGHVIDVKKVAEGSVNQVLVSTRDIYRPALKVNASDIAVIHNHPGGDPDPSAADLNCARKCRDAGEILGIRLSDFIVMGAPGKPGEKDYLSFREERIFEEYGW